MTPEEVIERIVAWLKEEPRLLAVAADLSYTAYIGFNEVYEWVCEVVFDDGYGETVLESLMIDLQYLNDIRHEIPVGTLYNFEESHIAELGERILSA